jgi:hypothetical protein
MAMSLLELLLCEGGMALQTREMSTHKRRVLEVGLGRHHRAHQLYVIEDGLLERRPFQVSPDERRPAESSALEVGVLQVGIAQASSSEVRSFQMSVL